MKKIAFVCLLAFAGSSSFANHTVAAADSIPANDKDVQSIDAILGALYDVISGPAGQKRNWDRMRTLFLPEGRLVATGVRADGSIGKRIMSVEDYINSSGPVLEKNGFFEQEIGRKTDQFGGVAQVFSTYESRKTLADEKPFMRGINSIQLWFDGKRWWVLSVFWQSETPQLPIPAQYLKQ
ncbi:hypothetical protein [Paraflavitalea sp. CAU 1676]|uniref:hypothetical protein n=1 Tax=Paraflavitalea sp. CAU 1676 TaxID=3032598 RepID=UPI0023DAEBDE|nr:hypothetical protein [Paraflavitalea sp. CAU 1676]MDF2190968.1 hypothetical protein [Paraflavitalea sp. CAU 1676]